MRQTLDQWPIFEPRSEDQEQIPALPLNGGLDRQPRTRYRRIFLVQIKSYHRFLGCFLPRQ
jgi:hypothetical protein